MLPSFLTCREGEFLVAVQMKLCLKRECLKPINKEFPAQRRNILLEKM